METAEWQPIEPRGNVGFDYSQRNAIPGSPDNRQVQPEVPRTARHPAISERQCSQYHGEYGCLSDSIADNAVLIAIDAIIPARW
jgi:hypothetical protein